MQSTCLRNLNFLLQWFASAIPKHDKKSQRFRPHRRATYVDAVYCYRPISVVCRSVSLVSPAKNGGTDRDAVCVEDSGGPEDSRVRWGSRSPHEKGQFWGKGSPIVKYSLGLSAVSCAEMAEPIDLPFGLWTLVGRRKHNLKFNRIRRVAPMCPHGNEYD